MQWSALNRQHKVLLDNYLGQCNEFSNINYTNFVLWNDGRHYQIAQHQQHLYVRYQRNNTWCYLLPLTTGELVQAIAELISDEQLNAIHFDSLSKQQAEQLEQLSEITTTPWVAQRDQADYVYLISDLINLAGQAYRRQRNFVRQFHFQYDATYQTITNDNLDLAFQFIERWFADKPHATLEKQGIMSLLQQYEYSRCLGAMLIVDDTPVALTVGEKLNQDTIVIHVEKASKTHRGAYQVINREYLAREWSDYSYVNRQQDLGIEGLRQAKLSYRPIRLVDKGEVTVSRCQAEVAIDLSEALYAM